MQSIIRSEVVFFNFFFFICVRFVGCERSNASGYHFIYYIHIYSFGGVGRCGDVAVS